MLQLNYSDSDESSLDNAAEEEDQHLIEKVTSKSSGAEQVDGVGNNAKFEVEKHLGERFDGKQGQPIKTNDDENLHVGDGVAAAATGRDVKSVVDVDEKHILSSSFSKRFSRLKQRRMVMSATSSTKATNDKESDHPSSSSKAHHKETKGRNKRIESSKRRIDEERLNEYMPQAFSIFDSGNTNKKKRIEEDLDEALRLKDFDHAQEISDEMNKRNFASQVKGAFEAQNYSKIQQEKKEKRKQKQRKKLNWAFGHKERWETKGNM